MNDVNQYYGIMLRRYFEQFGHIFYRKVSIARFMYFQFYGALKNYDWAIQNLPYLPDEMKDWQESELYHWSDEPYLYDAHPDGVIVMRGGFVDIALKHLPKERYFLVSPNQAEADQIKTNLPDQDVHNIESYFQDNPNAVANLIAQVAKAIHSQTDDPLLGSPELLQLFRDKLPDAVRMIDAVHSLFEGLNIGAVLTISSLFTGNGLDCALNLVAKARRIPSFTCQHGLIVDNVVFGHIPILATKKMVWGKAALEWYQKYGIPETRVSVVGSPRFEIIFNQQWSDKNQLCHMLGIDPARKIVIFATQRFNLFKDSVRLVLEALRSLPEVFLVLLLHPSEGGAVEQYQELTAENSNCKVVRFGHISLYDALGGADFFVTCYSTAALEAMLFKLPVITVEPCEPEYSFAEEGASIRVTTAAELTQVVQRLISDAEFRKNSVAQYQKYILEHCIPDGMASKRLFSEITTLCQTSGKA